MNKNSDLMHHPSSGATLMATKTFDLDDAIELSAKEVRDMIDQLDEPADLISQLDQAQGDVHSGKKATVYVLIAII